MAAKPKTIRHTDDCPGVHPETGRCLCSLVRMCDERELPREFHEFYNHDEEDQHYWLPDGSGPYRWDGSEA